MKKINLESKVLGEVVKIEKKRTLSWIVRFVLLVLVFIAAIGSLLILAIQIIAERGSLDMFQLLGEDSEIIKEFWRDTLATFIAELPQRELVLAAVLVIVLVLFLAFSREAFRIIRQKRKKISEFEKRK